MLKKNKLNIIYEDKEFIVVNKPSGMLCISTEKEKENTLYHNVLLYEKKKNKNNKIFIVHRLDRETSGLILFAKNQKIKSLLQEKWNDLVTYRGYIAIVCGNLQKDSDTIKSYLKENKKFMSHSDPKEGKLAITKYRKVLENHNYTLVEINILTGRKNQIRVHMSDINNPIIGDKKYGSDVNPIKRMALHAYKLSFKHPISGKEYSFETDIPNEFLKLF